MADQTPKPAQPRPIAAPPASSAAAPTPQPVANPQPAAAHGPAIQQPPAAAPTAPVMTTQPVPAAQQPAAPARQPTEGLSPATDPTIGLVPDNAVQRDIPEPAVHLAVHRQVDQVARVGLDDIAKDVAKRHNIDNPADITSHAIAVRVAVALDQVVNLVNTDAASYGVVQSQTVQAVKDATDHAYKQLEVLDAVVDTTEKLILETIRRLEPAMPEGVTLYDEAKPPQTPPKAGKGGKSSE